MSEFRGGFVIHGGMTSYKCPDGVFWAIFSAEALYPVGTVFDQQWFAIWSFAKVCVVNSSADFALIFHNQEVRNGLIGQGLLERAVNIVDPTKPVVRGHKTWKLTAVVIPAMPAPLQTCDSA